MTSMDKKIKELNDRLGYKTGVDFKSTFQFWGENIYKNKPVLVGSSLAGGLFILTSASLLTSGILGVAAWYAYKNYENFMEVK